MHENLAVVSSINPNLPAGSTFVVRDRFGTSNLFNGAQIGGVGEYRFGRWSVDVRGSVALGGTQQYVNIDGSTISAGAGLGAMNSTGGLLAQSSNIGGHTRSRLVSWRKSASISATSSPTISARFVGYNFLYWSSVVRPAEQIDRVVNPNLIPPADRRRSQRPTAIQLQRLRLLGTGHQFGVRRPLVRKRVYRSLNAAYGLAPPASRKRRSRCRPHHRYTLCLARPCCLASSHCDPLAPPMKTRLIQTRTLTLHLGLLPGGVPDLRSACCFDTLPRRAMCHV